MTTVTKADVEQAVLDRLAGVDWRVVYGLDSAPGAERGDYEQVMLARRLRDALVRLNPGLSFKVLEDAFRRLTLLEGAPWRSATAPSTSIRWKV